MKFRSLGLVGCVLLLGCGRTALDVLATDSSTGGSAAQHIDDPGNDLSDVPSDDPSNDPSDDPSDAPSPNEPIPDDPMVDPDPAPPLLPEVTVATVVYGGDALPDGEVKSLVLVAPLEAQSGPFELTRKKLGEYAYSPHGKRFAFIDEAGLFAVDSWPPVATGLDTIETPLELVWVDDARLVVITATTIQLHDLEQGTRQTLIEEPASGGFGEDFHLARPSPDGQWLAFVDVSSSSEEVWLMRLDDPTNRTFVYGLVPSAVLAWFDWAPDSEHLAFNLSNMVPYVVSTKNGVVGDVAPLTFALGDNDEVPIFSFSPDGKALQYWFVGWDSTSPLVR